MKKSEATYAQELFARFESKDGFDRNQAEYQSVSNPEIAQLLTSKSGSGRGKPELTYRLGPNDLLVWEIKQDIKDFSSHGASGVGLETDYSLLTKKAFEDALEEYAIHLIRT